MTKVDRFLFLRVGDPAPDFTAQTLDDKPFKLGDLAGKFVLIDFWATTCAPCLADMPHVVNAYEQFGKDGRLAIVAVSLDANPARVQKYLEKQATAQKWTQLALGPADQNPVARRFLVSGIPASFLVDPQGKIVAKDLPGPALLKELGKLLPPTPPAPGSTN